MKIKRRPRPPVPPPDEGPTIGGRTFDHAQAQDAKEAGIGLGASNPANDKFRAIAGYALVRLALERETFIVDDIWKRIGDHPPTTSTNRVMGAVVTSFRSLGVIEAVGLTPSAQVQCHGNQRAVWRSRIYRP